MESWVLAIIIVLLGLKWAAQIGLEWLNRKHAKAHADALPDALKETIDDATYAKSVHYTLAKSRLEQVELTWSLIVLAAVLFSGFLPWSYQAIQARLGTSVWIDALFLCGIGLLLMAADLPLNWFEQFRLENRFGFNTTTVGLWIMDRVKGLLLGLVLGYPLLVLILQCVHWAGAAWWIWAWACLLVFQLIMLVLAPILILPLFNKFTPLPDGTLKDRLLRLARQTRFAARSIQVMDGSKRSRHSNAFFTGFGRFRKIVLFDTLIQQLQEPEVEAVLAHEIGHYKYGHVVRLLIWSALSSLAGFFALSWLAGQVWFYSAFGFAPGRLAPALLLFFLLAGLVTFWFGPLTHHWYRKFEYQADAFAAQALKGGRALVTGLRKLSEKNLSNLWPHPLYSAFYYSHPTLLEREQALQRQNTPATLKVKR